MTSQRSPPAAEAAYTGLVCVRVRACVHFPQTKVYVVKCLDIGLVGKLPKFN